MSNFVFWEKVITVIAKKHSRRIRNARLPTVCCFTMKRFEHVKGRWGVPVNWVCRSMGPCAIRSTLNTFEHVWGTRQTRHYLLPTLLTCGNYMYHIYRTNLQANVKKEFRNVRINVGWLWRKSRSAWSQGSGISILRNIADLKHFWKSLVKVISLPLF